MGARCAADAAGGRGDGGDAHARSRRAPRHRAAAAAAGCLSPVDEEKRQQAAAAWLLSTSPCACRSAISRRGRCACSPISPKRTATAAMRLTVEQNVLFRWVKAESLEPFYQRLAAAGLNAPDALSLSDVISCPGAESCRLAVTQSRGLGRVLTEYFSARPDLVDLVPSGEHPHQRLPEWMRPASHRFARLPGKRPQGRGQGGPAVLRARRWRHH